MDLKEFYKLKENLEDLVIREININNNVIGIVCLETITSSDDINNFILKRMSILDSFNKNDLKEYLNVYVITGYILMVISTVLVVFGLKGVPYKNEPIIESLGYLFVMILSNIILKEKITRKKLIGNLLIFLGIIVYYI